MYRAAALPSDFGINQQEHPFAKLHFSSSSPHRFGAAPTSSKTPVRRETTAANVKREERRETVRKTAVRSFAASFASSVKTSRLLRNSSLSSSRTPFFRVTLYFLLQLLGAERFFRPER